MNTDTKVAGGRVGEEVARRFLEKEGLAILETNYRFGHGEIDIVARDGEYLVFCEVKARWDDTYGPPEYAVTPKKQHQIRKVAAGYLYEREIRDQACRFDVIAIRFCNGVPEIHHIINAF